MERLEELSYRELLNTYGGGWGTRWNPIGSGLVMARAIAYDISETIAGWNAYWAIK